MYPQKSSAELIAILRNLPMKDPPRDFSAEVLPVLSPKKCSRWRQLLLWVKTPVVVTVAPLKLAGGVAAMGLLLLSLAFYPYFANGSFQSSTSKSQPQLVPVTFRLSNLEARTVYVIGSFNDWKPQGYAMKFDPAHNSWSLRIKIPPGRYEYTFLIDDQRTMPDPRAEFYKMDGFGSRNSILFATADDELAL